MDETNGKNLIIWYSPVKAGMHLIFLGLLLSWSCTFFIFCFCFGTNKAKINISHFLLCQKGILRLAFLSISSSYLFLLFNATWAGQACQTFNLVSLEETSPHPNKTTYWRPSFSLSLSPPSFHHQSPTSPSISTIQFFTNAPFLKTSYLQEHC